MAGSLLRAARRTRRRTNSVVNNPQPTTPIKVSAVSVAGDVLNVTFDQPVVLTGVPQYALTGVAGAVAESAAVTGPTTVAITYSTTIDTATGVTIPYEEPAVRNSSGGFVATSGMPIA